MDSKETVINRSVAEEIDGERSALRVGNRGLSVERLAEESHIPFRTLRRILKAEVDVKVADLIAIVAVINKYRRTPIDPMDILNRAVERAGGMESIVKELGIDPVAE